MVSQGRRKGVLEDAGALRDIIFSFFGGVKAADLEVFND